jgi:hypothetical protein
MAAGAVNPSMSEMGYEAMILDTKGAEAKVL